MGYAQSVGRLLGSGLLAVVILAGRSAAQGSTTSGVRRDSTDLSYRNRVLGVFDAETGLPIEDAEVVDLLTGTSARTTRTGTVSLAFLPEGGTLIRIRRIGYTMHTLIVVISPADTVPITVVLQHVVQLPEVVTYGRRGHYISPHLRAFEARRRIRASGYFLSEEEIRKDDGMPLADVLRSRMPAVHISQNGAHTLLVQSPRCIGGGPPDVYLDGMMWPHPMQQDPTLSSPSIGKRSDSVITPIRDSTMMPPTIQPIDLSDFQVWDLAGIEYYPDDLLMPAQFRHTPGACGALLLWTRER